MLAVAAAGVVYALTRDDDGGAATVAPPGLTVAELRPALLTEDDVGRGYDATTDTNGGLSNDQIQTSAECRRVLDAFDTSGSDDDVEVEFEGVAGSSVSHTLSLVDEGEPTLDEARDALGKCGTIKWDDGETQGEIHLQTTDVDGLGDGAFGLELGVEATYRGVGVSIDGYGIYSMRHGVASSVGMFGGIDPATLKAEAVDRDMVHDLALRADEKLSQVVED